MNLELMRAQLYSARATIDAVLFQLDGQTSAVAPKTGCPNCGAPDEKQVDASTLGGGVAVKQCLACRTEYPA